MGKSYNDGFYRNIVVYDIKVGRCSQLNEYMKLYEYQRSRSFIDLVPNHILNDFIHVYIPRTGTDNPLETNF